MLTDLEALIAIRDRITPEAQFCQGHYAVDAAGQRTLYFYKEAVAWCAIGSYFKSCYPEGGSIRNCSNRVYEALEEMARRMHPDIGSNINAMPEVNDHHGHQATLDVIEACILEERNRNVV